MLNYKSTSIVFIIVSCLLGLLCFAFKISFWWLLFPIIIYKTLIICGSANIQSNFFTKVKCNTITSEKLISITFDDGPNPIHTPKILSVLSEDKTPATFFVIGKNIQGNENLLKQIDAEGHIIGNHTFSHSFFIDFKSKLGFIYDLDVTSDLIYKIIGKRTKLFRPPYGVTTPQMAKAIKALNYYTIGWNVRSLDTTSDSEAKIAQRVISEIKPGAIILFHDTSEKTVAVLKQTLNFANENGFKIVSVEKLLNIKAYE